MLVNIDPNDIDKVLKLFYLNYHLGKHYYDTVSKVIPDRSTQTKILCHLIEQSILNPWGKARDNFVLTENGRDIIETYENYAQYLENEKSLKEEAKKINDARNETILNNARLSRFQVKTFWYFFYATIVLGVISTSATIYQITKEPTEKHIERIVKKQIEDLQKSNIIGNHQTSQDTLRQ